MNTTPKNDPDRDVAQASPPAGSGGVSPPLSTRAATELRRSAVTEMLKGIKETILFLHSPSPLDGERAAARDNAAERATRTLATLKLAKRGLETFLTGSFVLLTGTLPVPNTHFDQCLRGSLPVLPVQPPKGPPRPSKSCSSSFSSSS